MTVKKVLIGISATLFLTLTLISASWAAPAITNYRFDDIYGPSGAGAQWVVVTASGGTAGAPTTTEMKTIANFVNNRDSVYLINGGLNTMEAIETIFMVLPGSSMSTTIEFDWMAPHPVGSSYTQDILTDYSSYQVVKNPLSSTSGPNKLWRLDFSKTSGVSTYETTRGNLIFQQNPNTTPSQTLQIPLIIANVCDDTAEANPLLFRAAMRETYSGSKAGNIVAYDRFTWNVMSDLEIGNDTDWVFVPVPKLPIDSNTINYNLTTDITNYSGTRYALQRYDGFTWATMLPSRWAMDLPASVKEVNPSIVLDELSHVPPGLITTYSQNFNVVSGVKGIFHMYPVDPASGFRNLTLSHPSVFGLDLGSESDSDYIVTGFQLLASDAGFLGKVASTMGERKVGMPTTANNVMSGSTSQGYVAGDAINTLSIESKIPKALLSSGDVKGLLPLHITFNLPRSNRFVAPKWDALLTEWKRSGNIKSLFSDSFSLYMHDSEKKNLDMFRWLNDKGVFDKTIKVFLDESKDCITVSFIAMLMDGYDTTLALVQDKSVTTDNSYLVMRDGNANNKWDMTFFTAPVDYVPSDVSGGGGGGCNVGLSIPMFVLLGSLAAYLKRKK